jgi:ABC-type multidrug transport system ATPase subunit/ABC-type multidrug transport system permease subunit
MSGAENNDNEGGQGGNTMFGTNSSYTIPLVKLNIKNITYEPLTETYSSTNSQNEYKKLSPSQKKKDTSSGGSGSGSSSNVTYNNINNNNSTSNQSIVKRKMILKNITPPPIEPYKLQAWMGPSGSGKTTLLSIATGVIEANHDPDAFSDEKSSITMNNDSIDLLRKKKANNGDSREGSFPKELMGVVWQDDLLLSNLTVRETIEFAAKLKTSMDKIHRVDEMVDQVLDDLSLTSVQHSLIGQSSLGQGRGISGGERKRVSVAQELVTRPSLIFLDEPTSGLDSTSALELMLTLKNLAQKGGHSIVTVVHQPRTTIFELMDDLLLLSKGEEVYSGPAGGVQQILESCPIIGFDLPPQTNIADWIIDVVHKDEARIQIKGRQNNAGNHEANEHPFDEENAKYTDRCLPRHWINSKSSIDETTDQQGNQNEPKLSTAVEIRNSVPKYMASFTTQLVLLTRRELKQTRGEMISTASIISQLAYFFFETTMWFRLKDDTDNVYARNSLLFFFIIAQANGLVISSVPIFKRDLNLVSRERSKKMYRVLPYYIAKTLAEMTTTIILPMIHIAAVYWTTNLRAGVAPFFMFLILFYLTLTSAQSVGFIISAALPSLQLALIITPTIGIFLFILGGFYIPFSTMPVWISWTKWLSFATYGYSGLLINEFSGRDIPCASDVSVTIGGTAGECPASGDGVLEALGITGLLSNIWFNIFMLIVLQTVFRWGAYVLLRRSP